MEPKQPETSNTRVARFEALDSPETVKEQIPLTAKAKESVLRGRSAIRDALSGKDRRLVVILGPCSIHDPKAALEYADRLLRLRPAVEDRLLLVMRVYFEKPRTTIGWKGLINDPHMDGTEDINQGLRTARQILLQVAEKGLPCATEFLDPIVPQYTSDLVSWAAIGARTTESQTHREMASGLSMPVGFKNSTDGDLQNAMDAMVSARHAHSFLGIDQKGCTAIVRTTGNSDVHVVLRGGHGRANYSAAHVAFARVALGANETNRLIMVDCSHGNSGKDYRKQPEVFQDLIKQSMHGEVAILGMMLESHLHEGNQKLVVGQPLKYGVSVTDGCIDWATTEKLLREGRDTLDKAC